MMRLKERLDRRLARMSDDAKLDLEFALMMVMGLWAWLTAAFVILAVVGYMVDSWWWRPSIPGAVLCLVVAIAFSRLSSYVARDVIHAWDWDLW